MGQTQEPCLRLRHKGAREQAGQLGAHPGQNQGQRLRLGRSLEAEAQARTGAGAAGGGSR